MYDYITQGRAGRAGKGREGRKVGVCWFGDVMVVGR